MKQELFFVVPKERKDAFNMLNNHIFKAKSAEDLNDKLYKKYNLNLPYFISIRSLLDNMNDNKINSNKFLIANAQLEICEELVVWEVMCILTESAKPNTEDISAVETFLYRNENAAFEKAGEMFRMLSEKMCTMYGSSNVEKSESKKKVFYAINVPTEKILYTIEISKKDLE